MEKMSCRVKMLLENRQDFRWEEVNVNIVSSFQRICLYHHSLFWMKNIFHVRKQAEFGITFISDVFFHNFP